MKVKNKYLSDRDYEFMHSLSAAVIQTTPSRVRVVLFFWVITILFFIIWANFAVIDEIARGNGEVVPNGQNQKIQNLEGGIVSEILVRDGDDVEKGQILLKIDNQKSNSSFSSNTIKANALEAKIIRLKAESTGKNFIISNELKNKIPKFIENEKALYNINLKQLSSKVNALNEQLKQKKSQLLEAKTHEKHLKLSSNMIEKELKMTKPMVKRGISSKRDFLKLKREANEVEDKFIAIKKSIPRLESAIKEVQSRKQETVLLFRSESKMKLNEAEAELKELKLNNEAFKDQVKRTVVRSPIKGIVQELFINTIGGVLRPGADIVEIVPSDQALLVEVKIKPADIAFIYIGQKAITKFSAYDFSIYGGLDGEVVLISADTITDEQGNVFYTVRIKTDKNFLGDEKKQLKIIPGMTVSADIIIGKKSVLDYILKPILKTKQYTFTER